MGGKFHLKLNIGSRPIANKYHEGKVKRTLKRELKVPEIAEGEANGPSLSWRDLAHATVMASHISASVVGGSEPAACVAACLACQRRFGVGEDSGEVVVCLRVFEHCPVESSSGLKLALGCSLRSSFVSACLSRVASVAPAGECGVCVSVVSPIKDDDEMVSSDPS